MAVGRGDGGEVGVALLLGVGRRERVGMTEPLIGQIDEMECPATNVVCLLFPNAQQ